MFDVAAVSGMITSLKAASDIVQALVGIRDAALIQAKVGELQGKIIAAQSAALATQEQQFTLLNRIRELEKEVADLKLWEAEKQRYELQEVGDRGAVVWTLKNEFVGGPEPVHHLCTNCYKDFKSILQKETRVPNLSEVLVCPYCKADFFLTGERDPRHASPQPASRQRRPN